MLSDPYIMTYVDVSLLRIRVKLVVAWPEISDVADHEIRRRIMREYRGRQVLQWVSIS
jgi:hypothetical protein